MDLFAVCVLSQDQPEAAPKVVSAQGETQVSAQAFFAGGGGTEGGVGSSFFAGGGGTSGGFGSSFCGRHGGVTGVTALDAAIQVLADCIIEAALEVSWSSDMEGDTKKLETHVLENYTMTTARNTTLSLHRLLLHNVCKL